MWLADQVGRRRRYESTCYLWSPTGSGHCPSFKHQICKWCIRYLDTYYKLKNFRWLSQFLSMRIHLPKDRTGKLPFGIISSSRRNGRLSRLKRLQTLLFWYDLSATWHFFFLHRKFIEIFLAFSCFISDVSFSSLSIKTTRSLGTSTSDVL